MPKDLTCFLSRHFSESTFKKVYQRRRSALLCELLLYCLLLPRQAYGYHRPDWVSRVPATDTKFRYYVGRASIAASEASGFNEATRDAIAQAIRENFGFRTQIQTESYEETTKVTSTKRIEELSRQVELHEFEQLDSFTEIAQQERFNVWILYRYSKQAILNELKRLETIKNDEVPNVFSNVGGTANAKDGILEIITKPNGATVIIDGSSSGILKTPIIIAGDMLSLGAHQIRLEHPSYEPIEEKIIMVPGERVRVSKILIPASGRIKVTTEPPNANVVISGKPVGTTPNEEFSVPAGKKIVIEITHAESERYVQEVEVERNELRTLHLPLPLKAAYLSVASDPSSAQINVNGQTFQTPTGPIKVSAGTHTITLRKDEFEEEIVSVTLRGGESRVLQTFRLRRIDEREIELGNPRWRFTATLLRTSQSPFKNPDYVFFGHGISAEYRFLPFLGVQAQLVYCYTRSNYLDADISGRSWIVGVGLPFHVFDWLFVAPEWLSNWTSFTAYYKKVGSEKSTSVRSQNTFGASV